MKRAAWGAAVVMATSAAWGQGRPKISGSIMEHAVPGRSTDPWDKSRLGRSRLGTLWFGPPLRREDLKGNVVLIEKWGFQSAASLASLPQMNRLHKKYQSAGLVVLGAHTQGSSKIQVVNVARKHGVTYRLYSDIYVPEDVVRDTPRVFLFDHTGQCVYEAQPTALLDKAVAALLAARPHPALGGKEYKLLPGEVAKVRAGKLGEAWILCEKKKGEEGEVGKEAAAMLEALSGHARERIIKAEKGKYEFPVETIQTFNELKASYAGSPIAAEMADRLGRLARNKKFQHELKAIRAYEEIADAVARANIPPCQGSEAAREQWLRKWGAAFGPIQARLEAMRKAFPDTEALLRAERLLGELLPGGKRPG